MESALRAAIRGGNLLPGARLPSSRALAAELGVARSTVVGAYEQLVAEGYLSTRHGSATRVASISSRPNSEPEVPRQSTPLMADFRPGEPDLTLFPRSDWSAAVRAVVRSARADTFGYGDPRGLLDLRAALARYLGRSRAVVADVDRIFVFSGFSDALHTLIHVMGEIDNRPVAVEEPCLPPHRSAIERAGATVRGAPVDASGIDVAALGHIDAGVVLTTPAHQYPLGVTLSAARRGQLIDWARASDAWIIEDDYDGEFRYDRQPVGSLQGLAPDRVIYAGTASKSLAPGVGIGWLVVPRQLVKPLTGHLHLRMTTSTIEQAALAWFVEAGRLDRHLRRMRTIYRRRRNQLLEMLASDAPQLAVTGIAAGLHVTTEVATVDQERELSSRASASSIGLHRLSIHYRGRPSAGGFVVGYTRPPEHSFAEALHRLRNFLRSSRDVLGP